MIAIAFVHAGPRGMQTIAEAMNGLEFPETPEIPAKFPKGWAPDIQAFRSGLDFSTVDLPTAEKAKLDDGYLRTIDKIPPYVLFMAHHRTKLLKTHRHRARKMHF